MSFIYFNKEAITQQDISFHREYLLANSSGIYSSSTIAGCHTRKYHGLFVAPQPQLNEHRHVLLSSLDESIAIKDGEQISLATRQYLGAIIPSGFHLMDSFAYEEVPTWIYSLEGFIIQKKVMLSQRSSQLYIQYAVLEAPRSFSLFLEPFLAFRCIHNLGQSLPIDYESAISAVKNGIRAKLYPSYSEVYIQTSKKSAFTANPQWYYQCEYQQERDRGYDYTEDLYRPGHITVDLKKHDRLIVSISLSECNTKQLTSRFRVGFSKAEPLVDMDSCLMNAARQFICSNGESEITAGFHWFGSWGRDTFISLPGLTLYAGNESAFFDVINSMLKDLKDGLFPNCGRGNTAVYNSADASLWFIWSLQQYALYTTDRNTIWSEYKDAIASTLWHYRRGTSLNIHTIDNGLLYEGLSNKALTWMDTVVDGLPVTPRAGLAVEINALWYNAINFALELANNAGDTEFVEEWKGMPALIADAFVKIFWNSERSCLADYVYDGQTDWSIRPNQIFAVSLPYSILRPEAQKSVVSIVKDKLLTPRGLRTLAMDDPKYIGVYSGDQPTRDKAYHQGTVWPWLLGHFAEAYYKVFGVAGKELISSIYKNFEDALLEYGMGTVAEIYDGDVPHAAKGAISQAWSVAELLRIRSMIKINKL